MVTEISGISHPDVIIPDQFDPLFPIKIEAVLIEWIPDVARQLEVNPDKLILGHSLRNLTARKTMLQLYLENGYTGSYPELVKQGFIEDATWHQSVTGLPEDIKEMLLEQIQIADSMDWGNPDDILRLHKLQVKTEQLAENFKASDPHAIEALVYFDSDPQQILSKHWKEYTGRETTTH